jgi:hypothetical protein
MSFEDEIRPLSPARAARLEALARIEHLPAHASAAETPEARRQLFRALEQDTLLLAQIEHRQSFELAAETLEQHALPAALDLNDPERFLRYGAMALTLRSLAEALATAGALPALVRAGRLALARNLAAQLPSEPARLGAEASVLAAWPQEPARAATLDRLLERLDALAWPSDELSAATFADALQQTAVTLAAELAPRWPGWLARLEPWPALAGATQGELAKSLLAQPSEEPTLWTWLARCPAAHRPSLTAWAAASYRVPSTCLAQLGLLDESWAEERRLALAALLGAVAAHDAAAASQLRDELGRPLAALASEAALDLAAPFLGLLCAADADELATRLGPLAGLLALYRATAAPTQATLEAGWRWLAPRLAEVRGRHLALYLDLVDALTPRRLVRELELVFASPAGREEVLVELAATTRSLALLERLHAKAELYSAMVTDSAAAGFELRARLLAQLGARLAVLAPETDPVARTLARLLPEEEDAFRELLAEVLVTAGRPAEAIAAGAGIRSPARRLTLRLRLEPPPAAQELTPAALYASVVDLSRLEDEIASLLALHEAPSEPPSPETGPLATVQHLHRRWLALADRARHTLDFEKATLLPFRRDPAAALLPLREALGVIESPSWLAAFTPELVALGSHSAEPLARAELREGLERLLDYEDVPWSERARAIRAILASQALIGHKERTRWLERSPVWARLGERGLTLERRATQGASGFDVDALGARVLRGTADPWHPDEIPTRRSLWQRGPLASMPTLGRAAVGAFKGAGRAGAERGLLWWLNAVLAPQLGQPRPDRSPIESPLSGALRRARALGREPRTPRVPKGDEPADEVDRERSVHGRWLPLRHRSHLRAWATRSPAAQARGVQLFVALLTALLLFNAPATRSDDPSLAPLALAGFLSLWALGAWPVARFFTARAQLQGGRPSLGRRVLWGAVGGFPLFGCCAFSVWASSARSLREVDDRCKLPFKGALSARWLASPWAFAGLAVGGYLAWQLLLHSLAGHPLSLFWLLVACRLAGFGLGCAYALPRLRARPDGALRAALLVPVLAAWWLPLSVAPLFALAAYFVTDPADQERTLTRAAWRRSAEAPSWLNLRRRLAGSPRHRSWRDLLRGRLAEPALLPELTERDLAVRRLAWLKASSLFVEACWLGAAVGPSALLESLERISLLLGLLASLLTVGLFTAAVGGSTRARGALWTSPVLPFVTWTQLGWGAGLATGQGLALGSGQELGNALVLLGLGGLLVGIVPALLSLVLPVPAPARASELRRFLTVLLLGGLLSWGLLLPSESVASPPAELWAALSLGALVAAAAQANALLSPHPVSVLGDRGLPLRRRLALALLVASSILPGGGLAIPSWFAWRQGLLARLATAPAAARPSPRGPHEG